MPKILIVDDDPACRRLVQHFLAPFGQCDLAYDGREAVAAFRIALDADVRYDLVCLDIMMPGLDGHQVLEAIRRMESRRGIHGSDGVKVIMTTALADSRHCIRAFREGCECYVTKPICGKDLLAHVRQLLDVPDGQPGLPPFPLPPALSDAAEPHPDSGEFTLPGPTESGPARTRAPRIEAADEPFAGPPVPPAPAPADRYLIVDDDRVCRELLRDILSPYGQCDFAYDGAEAVNAVRLAIDDGAPYHLVCLDIMMPGSSGHDALEGIRQVEAQRGLLGTDGVPVVMITALRNSKHCVRAFREGCECYVTKPIRETELLEQLETLGVLSRPRSVPGRGLERSST